MEVVLFSNLDELIHLAADWDRLARDVPFCGWAWLSSWWRHYGRNHQDPRPGRRLFVLGVFDSGKRLVGLAPWYLDRSLAKGRVVRFLGSGEVSSDYLSLLSEPSKEDAVAEAVARWLTGPKGSPDHPDAGGWDLIELDGVDATDAALGRLVEHLDNRGAEVHRRTALSCWRIELPESWEQFLATLSKDHRKKLRRTEREMIATGRVVLNTVGNIDELPGAMETLIDLHQRRRQAIGEPGCFASSRFEGFHREVTGRLLRRGQLRLHQIVLDSRPIAAEYHLNGGDLVYAYQSGIEPEAAQLSPGRLAHLLTLRRAIDEGYRGFDFLRGDEPYKAHWRGQERKNLEIRIVCPRPAARWRYGVWTAGRSAKHWIVG